MVSGPPAGSGTLEESEPLSVCPQILLVSLSLIVLPSFSPFSRRPSADDDYRTAAGRFGPLAC